MTDALKIGDVVQLNSGGPLMTVTLVDDEDGLQEIFCEYFHPDTHMHIDGDDSLWFPAAAVRKVSMIIAGPYYTHTQS